MKQFQNDFDQNTLEAMMERYRAELLRYQRATPPGKPTLEQSLLAVSAPTADAITVDEPFPDNNVSADEAILMPQPLAEPEPFENDILPDEIWDQPAVFVSESESVPMQLPPEQPQIFREDMPPIISLSSEQPAFACHTDFEKCIGGFGSFKPYERLGHITCAPFLQTPGVSTNVIVRFAVDIPFGAAEAVRCRRSFSVKFLCDDGEYDMLGCHIPVAVSSYPEVFSACSAAMRTDPISGLRSSESFWRFVIKYPESVSAVLRLYSDLGTIGSYRAMDGFSLPCWWVNSNGERTLVRTRWLSRQRPTTLNRFEAEELAGSDPDAVSRDFVNTLKNGEKIQYELAAQMISCERLDQPLDFDPFDPTDCWCEQQFPLRRLGLLTIDRLPESFAEQILPLAFSSSNIVKGIEYPLLAAKGGHAPALKYINSLSELERKTLIANMADELLSLPAGLLEKVLVLFTKIDLAFGRDVTAAIGGI